MGLDLRLAHSTAKPSIPQSNMEDSGVGKAGSNGGSDPGLRRLVPPQTFPCSFRRSGGRYRRVHESKQVVITIIK